VSVLSLNLITFHTLISYRHNKQTEATGTHSTIYENKHKRKRIKKEEEEKEKIYTCMHKEAELAIPA
jgi:hypothetical protein